MGRTGADSPTRFRLVPTNDHFFVLFRSAAANAAECGGAVARFGPDVLISSGLRKIGVFIVLSPLIGLALAMVFMIVVLWTFHRVNQVDRLNRLFRRGQLLSAAAFSLGHGGNDAQKTMGVILAVLIGSGRLPAVADVPLWVVLAAHTAIALGTLSGGWRIVKTLDRGSRGCSRSAAWRRRRRPLSRCSRPRLPGSRFPPRTRSAGRSSALAPSTGCPPFAGPSRRGSCGLGSSPSPARSWWLRSARCWCRR